MDIKLVSHAKDYIDDLANGINRNKSAQQFIIDNLGSILDGEFNN